MLNLNQFIQPNFDRFNLKIRDRFNLTRLNAAAPNIAVFVYL